MTEPVFSIHGATCASYTREFTDASHANVSNDEAGAHSRNPGRRRGDKDLCHSKEGAGSPVSTQERERHRCAVKLLPYFFTDEELISSNTDGTHGKLSLDSNKLNSLKVLVFSKFPVESAVEKEKLWKFIKTKINDRCRALKFTKRGH